jgi:hypothetical protein
MSAISYYTAEGLKEIERGIRLFKSVMQKHLQILLRLEIKGFI